MTANEVHVAVGELLAYKVEGLDGLGEDAR